jgi:hypothetical protein
VPTLADAGVPHPGSNVRALFMAPGTPPARVEAFADLLERLIDAGLGRGARPQRLEHVLQAGGSRRRRSSSSTRSDIRALLIELGFIQA